MGGSAGKSESDSSSGANFAQNIWGGQKGPLKDLYAQAGNLFGQLSPQVGGMVPGAVEQQQGVVDAAMPAWQQQLQGGAYADMGLGNQLSQSLQQSLANPTAMQDINNMIMGGAGNTYADAMKNQYMQDAQRTADQTLATLDARVSAGGLPGSSRHGTAQGQALGDINRNLQRNLAQTGFSTFDKDLDRKLQIAQQADQGTLARQQMLQQMLGSQQGAMTGGLGMGQGMQNLGLGQFSPYMMPWQQIGAYQQAIGAPTVLGSGTMFGDSSSKGSKLGFGLG